MDTVKHLIDWVTAHGADLLAALGALVALATIVVKLTPTQRDDAILERILVWLEKLSLINHKPPKRSDDQTDG